MEKYYRLKCKQFDGTFYYKISKNNFLFKDCEENYLLYSKPDEESDLIHLFQKEDCFILNRNDIESGDILCVHNNKRTSYFIFIDIFIDKTYKKETIFLVGKGFSSRREAIDFYNEHKEEIEDESMEIKTDFKNGNTFTYIRDKFPTEYNNKSVDFNVIAKSKYFRIVYF